MLDRKLLRYREFSIPFAAYRAGDLARPDLKEIILDLQVAHKEQHASLMETVNDDTFLQEKHSDLFEKIKEVVESLEEALDIALEALEGPEDEEDDLIEDALEIYKKGNLLLADVYFAIDDLWERAGGSGML